MTTPRCGYVALLGRPNAGKSTLLNALVGDKLAVVSRRPQTTRNRILGLVTEHETQIAFLDTPGVHHSKGRPLMNQAMNRVAIHAATDADLLVYLVDLVKTWTNEDMVHLRRILEATSAPFVVVATKCDLVKRFFYDSQLARIENSLDEFIKSEDGKPFAKRLVQKEAVLISAKRPELVKPFREFLAAYMPEGPWLFGKDDLTDMPTSFLVGELVREQLFRQLGEEIPYGAAVRINELQERDDMVVIKADVIVNRKSHKGMVIGERGSRIKEIGTEARASLEKHYSKKVYLELSVLVEEGWISDEKLMAELAHLSDLPALSELPGNEDDGPVVLTDR